MHRALRWESAVCNDKRIARAQQIHRKNCKNVKSVINITAPQRFSHLANNAKKKQLMEERQQMIDQSNRHLVNKLERISNPIKSDAKGTSSFIPGYRLGPDQCTIVDHRNVGAGQAKSLRNGIRRRDKIKIQAENQAIVARILGSTGSCLTADELRREWKQVRKYLKNSRTVKDKSRQKHRRRPTRPKTRVSPSVKPHSAARSIKEKPIAAWASASEEGIVVDVAAESCAEYGNKQQSKLTASKPEAEKVIESAKAPVPSPTKHSVLHAEPTKIIQDHVLDHVPVAELQPEIVENISPDLQVFSGGIAVTGNPLTLVVRSSSDQLILQATCTSFGSLTEQHSELRLSKKDQQHFVHDLNAQKAAELCDSDLDLESWLNNHQLSNIYSMLTTSRIRTVCELQHVEERDLATLVEDNSDLMKRLLQALRSSDQPSVASGQLKLFRHLKKYLAYDENSQRLSLLPPPKLKRKSKRKSSTSTNKIDSPSRKASRRPNSNATAAVCDSDQVAIVVTTATRESSESTTLEKIQSAVRLQAVYRIVQAKNRLHRLKVKRTNEGGTMHPMPGTDEGSSGWYQAKSEVFYFHVDQATGEWSKVQGPLSELEWKHQRFREFRRKEELTPEPEFNNGRPNEKSSDNAGRRQDALPVCNDGLQQDQKRGLTTNRSIDLRPEYEAVYNAAIKFQALYRARRARAQVARSHVQRFGTLLAMPGTVQGQSGWYELNDEVIEYRVDETDDSKWIKERGPIGRQEWRELANHSA